MKYLSKKVAALALAAVAVPAVLVGVSHASDHADTPDLAANPGSDISDVFAFPSPTDPSKVVFVMNVHPLIGPGQGSSVSFDPNVLYQFKIDTSGDGVEDKVIQAKFSGTGASQKVQISGPVKPSLKGSQSRIESPYAIEGTVNAEFSPASGVKVFAGPREDPFFFDLEQFFNILPDRATPITGIPVANPNTPQATSWRAPGAAKDFLSNGQYNVLSIVVELSRNLLK